jgi:hypothetical protein
LALTDLDLEDSCRHSFVCDLSFAIISSAKVFQDPQEGHFPSHLTDSWPQDWQKNVVFVLAKVLNNNKYKPGYSSDATSIDEIQKHFFIL